ncbi:MAG TPA: hypothetical protein PKU97_23815, partial [Kofleriaceae bacterium]|nr:hypothetical protein [Kofleriaceae bacterium]
MTVATAHDGRGPGTSHSADAAARALADVQRNLRRDARLLTRFFEAPPVSRDRCRFRRPGRL